MLDHGEHAVQGSAFFTFVSARLSGVFVRLRVHRHVRCRHFRTVVNHQVKNKGARDSDEGNDDRQDDRHSNPSQLTCQQSEKTEQPRRMGSLLPEIRSFPEGHDATGPLMSEIAL